MRRQQILILILWLSLTGIAFALLFLKSMGYKNPAIIGSTADLVAWLGAVTGVTLTGMVGTMILQERKPELKTLPAASRFIFWLTLVICVVYWLVAFALIFGWTVRYEGERVVTMVEWLNAQLPWLVFLQAMLFALLAFFFNQMRVKQAAEAAVAP